MDLAITFNTIVTSTWFWFSWPFVGVLSLYLVVKLFGGHINTYRHLLSMMLYGCVGGYILLCFAILLLVFGVTIDVINSKKWDAKLPWVKPDE